jgi:hypothetical protein
MAILLFNWFGYRLITSVLEENANNQLETALDNNDYSESQLISIKIPVSYLPYYKNSQSFERVDGRVEIQGLEYKFVKRRIYNDSLELLCIPNAAVMKLNAAKDEIFRILNDLQHPGTDKLANTHHTSPKPLFKRKYTVIDPYKLNDNYFIIPDHSYHLVFRTTSRHQLIVEQPPDNA